MVVGAGRAHFRVALGDTPLDLRCAGGPENGLLPAGLAGGTENGHSVNPDTRLMFPIVRFWRV